MAGLFNRYIRLSEKEAVREEASKDTQKSGEKEESLICPQCGQSLDKEQVKTNNYICYHCGNYFRVRTKNRIRMVADVKSFEPWLEEMPVSNPLNFPDYEEKIAQSVEKTGLSEGVTVGYATVFGEPVVLGICDSRFLMGSMGHVVGERIAAAVEQATRMKLPVILFCCSGGARMQEGIISLMQMAKTSAALKKHSQQGLLYVPILTDPTTGGVTASFAMLGDIILAEPGALIGFAGPRVIEQTIGGKLPPGFQRAEFLVEHGIIDGIVERDDLKQTIYHIIKMHKANPMSYSDFRNESAVGYEPHETVKEKMFHAAVKTPWQKVKAARSVDRPSALEFIHTIFEDFMELHGDRNFRDDPAVVGGIAYLDGQPVTVIGIQKGKDAKECQIRNYGMPSPEGYRKALRLMKQAEKFHRPVINFINTSGAFCGLEAEERGQGEAIARNLYEMSALKTPILSILIGEGGSGGALALSVANQVWMMENAIYAILSPEGFSSILWKDSKRAEEAASVMGITAEELKKMNIIERIIPEYGGADSQTLEAIAMYMKKNMKEFLCAYEGMDAERIAAERYERFRRF